VGAGRAARTYAALPGSSCDFSPKSARVRKVIKSGYENGSNVTKRKIRKSINQKANTKATMLCFHCTEIPRWLYAFGGKNVNRKYADLRFDYSLTPIEFSDLTDYMALRTNERTNCSNPHPSTGIKNVR
jgi:hypothetical protein